MQEVIHNKPFFRKIKEEKERKEVIGQIDKIWQTIPLIMWTWSL